MLFVRDKGQMCNNIYQYAHVFAWAREHNIRCVSMRFAYKYKHFAICHDRWHRPYIYIIGKMLAATGLIPTVTFNDINKDKRDEEHVMLSHRMVMAEGWCVRYNELFMKYLADIQQLFAFDKDIIDTVESKMHHSDRLRIGIHIRRGDYATWCHGAYFFNDEEYIAHARQLLGLTGNSTVDIFVCGNDPAMNKEAYQTALSSDGITVSFPDGSAVEDLYLLSSCDYIIGPPSSFSMVATMYGKARLYWMDHRKKTPLSLDSFIGIEECINTFDGYYLD